MAVGWGGVSDQLIICAHMNWSPFPRPTCFPTPDCELLGRRAVVVHVTDVAVWVSSSTRLWTWEVRRIQLFNWGNSGSSDGKESAAQWGRPGLDPWVGKIPWRRAWQPTPVFLPGESPWTEEPGGLQSMGSQRVGHDFTFTFFQATKHRTARKFASALWDAASVPSPSCRWQSSSAWASHAPSLSNDSQPIRHNEWSSPNSYFITSIYYPGMKLLD